ncbi:MAG: HDOD domain-containing protein [Acidobacteriota bacterium]
MEVVHERRFPELAAHEHRVSHLVSRLPAHGLAFEVCHDFDAAAEFAACEGRSLAQAIAEFFEAPGSAAQAELQQLVVPAVSFTPSQLPVMPKAGSRLLRTTEEGTSAAELEDIAASDPMIAAQLLSAANSARFGSRFEIRSLREAVMRVGVPEARKVLLASCVGGLFASRALQELWEHSQFVADAAWELAALAGVEPDTAWVAGLLHDIGRVGFSTAPAARCGEEQEWLAAGFSLVYAETLVFGKDHAGLGGELLREWTLPAGIVEAVEYHHRPEVCPSRLCAVLHLAEDLSVRAGKTPEEDLWPGLRRQTAFERAGISEAQVEELMSRQAVVKIA